MPDSSDGRGEHDFQSKPRWVQDAAADPVMADTIKADSIKIEH